jgi:hypothetical protein
VPTRAVSRLGAGALLLSACAGTAEPIGEESQAITSGSPASDAAVVALVDRRTSSSAPPPSVRCSGSVIAERLVLTAAHCIQQRARGVLEVFFGTSPGAPGGEFRAVTAHRVHPSYDHQFDDHDVALVWLEAPAPVVPVAMLADALPASALGRPGRLVGFGHTVAGGDDAAPEKRTGDVLLSELSEHTVRYGAAPGMSCNGDSGGPLLVDVGEGEMLAGVVSSGDARCRRFGVAARIDVQRAEFVEPLLDGAPPRTAGIDVEALCRTTCTDDGECPHDLVCLGDLAGIHRCVLPNLPAGAFESSCESDEECSGGSCVPLGGRGRCFRPCADDTSPTQREASGACSLHAPAHGPAGTWMAALAHLASLSVALGYRRYGRKLVPGACGSPRTKPSTSMREPGAPPLPAR